MTEYEMASLFAVLYQGVFTYLETFIAIMVSVLVAGYLAGPKLTRTMVVVIVGLFTMLTMVSAWNILGALNDGTNLALEIGKAKASAGSSLHWMFKDNPPEMFVYFMPALSTILITAYIGTLVFFFHARHHPREEP